MPKLEVLVSVKNDDSNIEYKTTAILTDDVIKYKSEDNTTEIFDYINNKLTRENNELRMDYVFDLNKETKGTVFVKDLNRELEVNVKTNKIERNKNDIEIEFVVEDNTIKYRIEVIK
jgi:hypothetical protein